jgi:hypothetical protein
MDSNPTSRPADSSKYSMPHASFVACEQRAGKQRRHAARRSSSKTAGCHNSLGAPALSGPRYSLRGPDGAELEAESIGEGKESTLEQLPWATAPPR